MKSIFAGLILILFGFNSVTFSQNSLPKCEGNDSSKWSKCFGTERVEDKEAGISSYVGLGIEVEMEAGVIKVISPIDDSPASRAGIKAGDHIVRIDGDQVQGKTLMEALILMRGSEGTPIEIVIARKGEKKTIELKIVREAIQTTFKRAKYAGEYENGKFHGQGTYTGRYGDNYVGQFKDGEFNGQGTYTWVTKKGAKYVGRFKNDKYHGQGTYIFADGAKYVGRFKKGKFHGQGTYTGSDGRKYIGKWEKNKFHGRGTFNYPDGRVEKGIWKYGRLVE
jgi:hypothetical protein